MASRDETWNHREPGPATKDMLVWAKRMLLGVPDDIANPILLAFIAEWSDPVTPPAPELSSSPWKCAICDEPVRIGDGLRPVHLAGPANHEAQLSHEDMTKVLEAFISKCK